MHVGDVQAQRPRPFASAALVILAGVVAVSPARAAGDSVHAEAAASVLRPTALFVDVMTGFVPYANDVAVTVGVGLRIARRHEIYARAGLIPTGDDRGHGAGTIGYRIALRPDKIVRPLFGAVVLGVPQTCGHDAWGRPDCAAPPLFVFAGTVGLRIEPTSWLGLFSVLTIGVDTFPNPFGMVEAGLNFPLPSW
jgi:hypothetical protein